MFRKIVLLTAFLGILFFLKANFRFEDTIKYDGPNTSGFGLPHGGTFYAAVRFHPQQSCTLKAITFYQYQPSASGWWIYLYAEGQPTYPGSKVDSIFYLGMPGPSGWVRVNFSLSYFCAGGVDFWIGVKLTHSAGQTPIGIDAGPSSTRPHSFLSPNGTIWQTLPAYGQNNNFNIRALVRYIHPVNDYGIDEIIGPSNLHFQDSIMIPKARLKNYGIGIVIRPLLVTCTIIGTNGVIRYTDIQMVSLEPNDTVSIAFNPFILTIPESLTIITSIIINPPFPNDEVNQNNREILLIPLRYFEDFEANNGGYGPVGIWEWGVPIPPPNAYSGTKLWGTILAGNYPNVCNAPLTTFEFVATNHNPVLRFWHWYDINLGDGGNVKISTNNGATWVVINPIFGYSGIGLPGSPMPNESCYSATCTTWTEAVFKLPLVAGQRFLLRWHFCSDNANNARGWYIDDVSGIGFSAQLTELKETQKNNLIHSSLHNLSNLITNRLAQIVFSLTNPSQVSLKIYDAKGKLIKNLVDGLISSGVHNVSWDCTDERGHKVATGIYFYSLETPKQSCCRKLVVYR
ncbi:MAG: hypothetical protein N2748_01850 [candidate division WOR-3 bacterium]|nr:hypothetical protein [candidate division WOR-3 bacterium]